MNCICIIYSYYPLHLTELTSSFAVFGVKTSGITFLNITIRYQIELSLS